MVVVRESPLARPSPSKNPAQWPPKSPFQALLSSPSGRQKWKEYKERGDERSPSPSPSPMRKSVRDAAALQAMSVASDGEDGSGSGSGSDEDEETLQLRLREIQAKLKLKKLKKGGPAREEWRTRSRSPEKEDRDVEMRSRQAVSASQRATTKSRTLYTEALPTEVEVPLSPVRDRGAALEPISPARKRLGLNSAPKASDVSLKRARDGTQLPRSESSILSRNQLPEPAKPKLSFSDRLKQSKTDSQDREAKQERIGKSRSGGFGGHLHPPAEGARASTVRERPRSQVVEDVKRPASSHQPNVAGRTGTENGISRTSSTRSSQTTRETLQRATNGLRTTRSQSRAETSPAQDETEAGSAYDPFSQTHLTKRHIPHPDIARVMEDKEIYTLPRLLKEVKAPHYDPPDIEGDYVIFAILASKSSPFDQKAGHRTNDENRPQEDAEKPRNKFMVLHLTDLKWEVDLFLFGSGFDQFWKLTPGTLVAILNPGIMPPKGNQNTGRFSLKLGSSEDCVMEIGVARDLGYCSSVKKDGNACGTWIDKRSTEICEFHLNLMIDRERKHRMEVNTMHRNKRNTSPNRNPDWKPKSKSRAEGGFDNRPGKAQRGNYSREYGSLYSVRGTSTANLLDAEDKTHLDQEASRKRIAAAQHERDLAKKLGAMGDSVGSEYMRAKQGPNSVANGNGTKGSGRLGDTPYFEKPSASSLGLLGKKASEQNLSPGKDRKRHFGTGAISSAGTAAMGWGGAKKAGLLQPKEKEVVLESGQTRLGVPDVSNGRRPGIVRGRSEEGSLSPKKRARFQLGGKGIREPGRESLGGELVGGKGDEDDGLDIV